jgi:hypothetical protein
MKKHDQLDLTILQGMHRIPGQEVEIIQGRPEYAICLYSSRQRITPTTTTQVGVLQAVSRAAQSKRLSSDDPFLNVIEVWITSTAAVAICDVVKYNLSSGTFLLSFMLDGDVYELHSIVEVADGAFGLDALPPVLTAN